MNILELIIGLLTLAPQEIEAVLQVIGHAKGHQVLTNAAAATQKAAPTK